MENKELLEYIRIMLKEELKRELNPIRKAQEDIKKEQEGMKTSLEGIKISQKGIEKRQDEIFQVVKAVEHSNHTGKAEIDNLTHKVAHVEGTMNGLGDFIQKRKAQ